MTTAPGTVLKMQMDSLHAGELARLDSLLAIPDLDVSIELWLPQSMSAENLTSLIHYLNNHRGENLVHIQIRRFVQAPDLSDDVGRRQVAIPERYLFPAGKTLQDLFLDCSETLTVPAWFRQYSRPYHSAHDLRMPKIRRAFKRFAVWAERYVAAHHTTQLWLYGIGLLLCGALVKWFPEHGALPLPIWPVVILGFALLAVASCRLLLALLVRIHKAYRHLKGANV